jgi:putative spermidine/putrescine transport system ATP-binding protein
MRDGKTEQIDRPDVVYRDPQTPFVAGFIGTMNLVEGNVTDGQFSRAGISAFLPIPDGLVTLAIRPEVVDLIAAEQGQAKVHRVTDYGTHGLVDIDLPESIRIKAIVSHPDLFAAGQGVDLSIRAVAAFRDGRQVFRS